MKKNTITFLIVIINVIILSQTYAQQPYYDALNLSKLTTTPTSGILDRNDTTVLRILNNYVPSFAKNDGDKIQNCFNPTSGNKPDPNPFIELSGSLRSTENIIFKNGMNNLLKSAGSLDVTNFADGLAQFLIQRSKEELNVAFFRKFQDYLQKYPEVQIVFPSATDFLNQIYSYQYASMLPALRAAFQKDLNGFSTNLLNLRDQSKYVGYDVNSEIKKRADEIIRLFDTPEGRSIAGALLVSNGIVNGDNVADIINDLANDMISTKTEDNFSNTIRFVDLISQSLRSTDEGLVWVTKQQVNDLVNDDNALRIYFGLIYAMNQKSKQPIVFTINGAKNPLSGPNSFLDALNEKWQQAISFKESYATMAKAMSEVADNAKNIIDAKKQADQPSILIYADFASSISNALKLSVNFLSANSDIFPSASLHSPEIIKFTNIIEDATNACYDLKSQNYTALVIHTSSILSEILGAGYTHKDQFLKYGIFMANVVEAKSSAEVNAAIEAAVLPVGSSSIKRETDFNVSLNAYIGPYGGFEYMPALKQNKWAPTTGLTAPVGIAFSWGNLGKGPKECNCKKPGGKSLALFVPLIDVGSVASFRIKNDSTEIASKITLNNIVSPGLYLYYGFGKSPVSIGLGCQLGPQLRGITATDLNIDKNYYLRLGFNLVADIPFFNLFTNN